MANSFGGRIFNTVGKTAWALSILGGVGRTNDAPEVLHVVNEGGKAETSLVTENAEAKGKLLFVEKGRGDDGKHQEPSEPTETFARREEARLRPPAEQEGPVDRSNGMPHGGDPLHSHVSPLLQSVGATAAARFSYADAGPVPTMPELTQSPDNRQIMQQRDVTLREVRAQLPPNAAGYIARSAVDALVNDRYGRAAASDPNFALDATRWNALIADGSRALAEGGARDDRTSQAIGMLAQLPRAVDAFSAQAPGFRPSPTPRHAVDL